MNAAVIEAVAHNIAAFGSLLAAVGGIIVSLKVKKDTQELRPNSGSSIKDAMNRVEAKVETLGAKVTSNSETLAIVAGDVTALRGDVSEERKERQALDKRSEETHRRMWDAILLRQRREPRAQKRQYRHQNR